MPVGSPGYLQSFELVLLNDILLYFLLGSISNIDDLLVFHLFSDLTEFDISVGVEIFLAHLCNLQILGQIILLEYRFHFEFLLLSFIDLTFLIKNGSTVARSHKFLSFQLMLQSFAKAALFLFF